MIQEGASTKPVWASKADVETSQFASGGELVRDQVREYFLVAIAGQVMMERVRNIIMPRDTVEFPIMTTFGNAEDMWKPVGEYTALGEAQRVRSGYDNTQMTAREVMCEVRYPKHALKVQIEEGRYKQTLLTYLGLHTKAGWEELIINGDTAAGSNAFLRMFDGMIAGVSSYTFSAAGATLSESLLRQSKFTRPTAFRKEGSPAYFTTEEAQDGYDQELRAYNVDAAYMRLTDGSTVPTYKGRPVIDVPRFPIATNVTSVLDCDPKRFLFGIREGVEIDTEWNPRTRSYSVIMCAWIAQSWMYEAYEVLMTNVAST